MGVVRHFTFAVGASDDEEIRLGGEVEGGVLGHVDDAGVDGAFFGSGGDFFGEGGGGTGLGAVKDR